MSSTPSRIAIVGAGPGAPDLLTRRAEQPGYNAESYLMMLQEERGRTWTHLPRLALQRWDEAASSVSALSPPMMRRWYDENYFPRYPRGLYNMPESAST